MATVPVTRLKFPVRLLFPYGERLSVRLIPLMLATDDVRHLQRLLIAKRDLGQDASTSERAIQEGELGHFFRLMCGHLYEAMDAFANLDKENAGLLDAAANDDRARTALERLRQAWPGILSSKGRRSFIDVMRNFVTFHYIGEKLKTTLDRHEGDLDHPDLESTLVLSPHQGLGRYRVADYLVMFLIADELGVPREEFQARYVEGIGQAIELAGALGDVVDYLLVHLLAKHRDQLEQHEEVITIDPEIERARNRGTGEGGRRATMTAATPEEAMPTPPRP